MRYIMCTDDPRHYQVTYKTKHKTFPASLGVIL